MTVQTDIQTNITTGYRSAVFSAHSPLPTFSHSTSTYLLRSVRDCSCQKPNACISSCIMMPFLSQPGPTDRSWGPGFDICWPTDDQHLKKCWALTLARFVTGFVKMRCNNARNAIWGITCVLIPHCNIPIVSKSFCPNKEAHEGSYDVMKRLHVA